MIARLSEAIGATLVGNIFCPIASKISFHMKKKVLIAARYLQSMNLKTFLTLELSQYRKSGSMFSLSQPVAASSDCSRVGEAD